VASVCDSEAAYKLPAIEGQHDIYFGTYKVITERFQYFLTHRIREAMRDGSLAPMGGSGKVKYPIAGSGANLTSRALFLAQAVRPQHGYAKSNIAC
jgi:hypothetical protein